MLVFYGLAALVTMLYPAVSEAGRTFNHNETLVRDRG
jgi:hypothetical protein